MIAAKRTVEANVAKKEAIGQGGLSVVHNTAERHSYILELLKEQGYVKVVDLSDRFDVSEVTIRKDLRALEERNLLHRTRGGANLVNPFVLERPVEEKAGLHAAEKDRIGRAAAALVEEQDTIILASGTTMMYVAHHLFGTDGVTVVTSAMNVALVLSNLPNVEVLMLGGTVRPNSTSVVGPYAEEMLREHVCSKLFLGVDGFDLDFGLTTTNALEAHLNQVMMQAAERTIVVTDASKLGRRSFRRICSAADIDQVITDDRVDATVVEHLEKRGVDVTVV